MAKGQRNSENGSSNRRFTRFGGQAADWGSVDAEIIRSAIVAAAHAGGALRFGYSGDGGAYAVGIYGDGDKPYTEFIRPSENVDGILRDIESLFLDISTENGQKAKK